MRRKRTFTDQILAQREREHVDAGIETIRGLATFVARDALRVGTGDSAGSCGHAVIAAGAGAGAALGIDGEQHLATSEQFLELDDSLPPRLVLVGGGYIAAEFSHLAARAGAQVTVQQRGPQILERFDPDLVAMLMERSRHSASTCGLARPWRRSSGRVTPILCMPGRLTGG